MTAGFRDFFSRDAAAYAQFRPRYPAPLFEWLATLPAQRRLGWDCATGNGQAAAGLSARFERVVGTDASTAQLRAATPAPRTRYVACLAEATAIAARCVDLVTVAQALHWLDRPRFFAEVDRVIAPGGALAVIGYARLRTEPGIERAVWRFQDKTVGPYWTPERRLVDLGYRGLVIPIEEVKAPPFAIAAGLTLEGLLGYVGTWSAVTRYREATGQDPMIGLAEELGPLWGDPGQARRVEWPLSVRAGRWLENRE